MRHIVYRNLTNKIKKKQELELQTPTKPEYYLYKIAVNFYVQTNRTWPKKYGLPCKNLKTFIIVEHILNMGYFVKFY